MILVWDLAEAPGAVSVRAAVSEDLTGAKRFAFKLIPAAPEK